MKLLEQPADFWSKAQREQRVIQFPLGENLWAAIQLPTPLTTPEWAQFVAVLEAMKPGLIGDRVTHSVEDAPIGG